MSDCAADYLETALMTLALKLKHEVALTRTLRGDGRQEGFLGLFLSDREAQVMLDELAGRIAVEGGEEVARAIAELEQQLNDRRASFPGLIWNRLRETLDLAEAELDLLLLASAPAVDPRFGRVYGFLHDDMARRTLSLALAQRLLTSHDLDLCTLRRMLGAHQPLRAFGLLDLSDEGPLAEAQIRVADPIIDLLLGEPLPLPAGARLFAPPSMPGAPTPSDVAALAVQGDDPGRTALTVAGTLCCKLVHLPWSSLAGMPRSASRKAVQSASLKACLEGHLLFLDGFAAAGPELLQSTTFGLPRPAVIDAASASAWAACGLEAVPFECASSEPPLPPSLARAKKIPLLDRLGLAHVHGDSSALDAVVQNRMGAGMDGIAQRVDSQFTFDDLVLPNATLNALNDYVSWQAHADQVLGDWRLGTTFQKSAGNVAVFRGPPGTGKTMAAGVIANALGLPLFRVSLAGLVSKYIGETEKNLERLFECAEHSDIVLFFDEADALFGKRSEVKDAHDRYANIETSYLLQKIETYRGVAILATNLYQNIDEAFLRRIDLVVDFPSPGIEHRLALWQRLDRTEAPRCPKIDLAFLAAHFELTGGEIRNCILIAAHYAARESTAIGMDHLIRAIGKEYLKQGKALRKQTFGVYYRLLKDYL